jgi:asparagine synthase (glutamine-hydrolysing)
LHPQLRKQANAGRAPRYDLKRFDELPGGTALERVTGLCLRGYMTNQLLRDVDAVSMSHSLEVRVPFLDRLIADMALSLPDETKLNIRANHALRNSASYRETGVKRILVDAGRPLLPRGFDEQPKRGFLLPFDAWLRGPLKDILHETLDERQIRRRGWLDASEVSKVKENFFARPAGRGVGWAKPWLLLMLEVWCREVLEHNYNADSSPLRDAR